MSCFPDFRISFIVEYCENAYIFILWKIVDAERKVFDTNFLISFLIAGNDKGFFEMI
jgi:hypothetical protein